MRRNLEISGLQCEVLGLLFLLIAAVWQAQFNDWFDKTARDWQSYIQEDVNIALLTSIEELSKQGLGKTEMAKQDAWNKIYERTSQAVNKAIRERTSRENLDMGQARIFGWIRFFFFTLGAILIVVGKYLVLRHKRSNLPPNPDALTSGAPIS